MLLKKVSSASFGGKRCVSPTNTDAFLFRSCTINVDVASRVVIAVVFRLHNLESIMAFGAGFANLMANTLGGNGRETRSTAAAQAPAVGGAAISQTQGMSEDEAEDQQDFEVDPSRLLQRDPATAGQQGGLGISRNDWLHVQDVAQTPHTATPVATAGTPVTGQTGFDTPQAAQQGGGVWSPTTSARAVLAKRVLTAGEIQKEFELQPGTGATTTTVKAFKESVGDSPPYLLVFVFMMEGSPYLHLVHSISRFSHFAAGDNINNKYYAFLGDRTVENEPYPVMLQQNNAWNWEEVEVCVDPTAMRSWYNAHDNKEVCWYPGDLATKVNKRLPRMLLLPTILAKFVLSKQRCTPFQLYEEVMRLVLEGVLDEEAVEFVGVWLMAVGQTKSATTNSPALSMEYLSAPVMDPNFGAWKTALLNATIGPRMAGNDGSSIQSGQHGGGGRNTNTTDPLAASMMKMAQSMHVLAREVVNTTKTTTASGGSGGSTKTDTNVMTTYMLATLMGWMHITQEEKVEPVWPRLINTKHMDEARSILMRRMKEIAESRKPPLKFDKRVYYTDKQMKAILEMKPNSGDGTPTFASLGKALSIMANTPSSAAKVEEIRLREKADRETLGTRTYSEAIQIEAGEKTLPPGNLEGLSKLVSMFALQCLALYGESCD